MEMGEKMETTERQTEGSLPEQSTLRLTKPDMIETPKSSVGFIPDCVKDNDDDDEEEEEKEEEEEEEGGESLSLSLCLSASLLSSSVSVSFCLSMSLYVSL